MKSDIGNGVITDNIRSKKILIVPIGEIIQNPNNRNTHGKDQIERLSEIIKFQGFRSPLIVSNLSGMLVSGHGRLEAAKMAGFKSLPVIYQDFDSKEQEYAAMVSENSIAFWAELDLSGINADIGDLGPDFDLDLLGIKNFNIDPSELPTIEGAEELSSEEFDNFQHECPKCGFEWDA